MRLVEPGSGDGDTPEVLRRATLTITVKLAGEDSAVAGLIGLGAGVLPGAEVTIERVGTSGSRQRAVTDGGGLVRFGDLLPGDYRVTVFRLLTPQEIGILVQRNEDVTAFAGAGEVGVSAPSTEATVLAQANRERSSLVISEVSITLPRLPSGNFYRFGHYVEVYNNADTTIFLDGKVVVKGFFFGLSDANETFNCESMRRWREDPDGIWTQRFLEAFPGSGADYPLRPGETAVVATDAIDHRTLHPDLPDLSGADFEFIGSADVDNPSVPNMIRLGREFPFGHGLSFGLSQEVLVMAEPVDVSALPRENVPGVLDPEHWRIPANKILDVAVLGPTPAEERGLVENFGPLCARFTHENFDRGRAPLVDSSILEGIQRRVVAVRNGRKILQRTKVSALDFFSGPMTPGFIPD